MKRLFSPWRSSYASSVQGTKDPNAKPHDCAFCCQLAENKDLKNHILIRYEHCYVVLNKYPYNAGHVLIIPFEHASQLSALPASARVEIMEAVNTSVLAVQTILGAQGVNVGLNLGRAAGAGIPAHLHWHVLPRWEGDTNFLPTLAQVKTISFDLQDMYNKLQPFFQK
jgi:ATP adenylyltransferase